MSEDAFLADILEHPEDDTPRLVFADWLDDHAQPERAEFIRLQVELARLSAHDPRRPALVKREQVLVQRYARQWFVPPAGWQPGQAFFVRRGFPDTLALGTEDLLEQAPQLLERWPITRLRGSYGMARSLHVVRALAESPWLSRIRSLEMFNGHIAGALVLRAVAASPHIAGLTSLYAGQCALGDGVVRLVAASPHLASLRHLDVRHNSITSAGVRALIGSAHRRATRSLSLCANRVSADDVVALLESSGWPALADLDLWNTNLDDPGLEQVVASPGLRKLTSLVLASNQFTDRGVQALAASPHAANLRFLNLSLNTISTSAIAALLASPHLQGLACLRLYKSGVHWRNRNRLREQFGERISFEQSR
jgi:uncharacterized protein (TIGR02996 family)